MPSCYLLTAAQLAEKLAQGFTLNSGPHDTQAECTAICGVSSSSQSSSGSPTSIDTPCCSSVPQTLYATFTGSCAGSYRFQLSPGSDFWENAETIGNCLAATMLFYCRDPGPQWTIDFPSAVTDSTIVWSCSPFMVEFTNVDMDAACGCGGTSDIVFTA